MSRDPRTMIHHARVQNMDSPIGGPVANQFHIITDDASVFQSYRTVIAVRPHDHEDGEPEVYLSAAYDCSRTTMKYLKQFLGHGISETRRRIEEGRYVVSEDL